MFIILNRMEKYDDIQETLFKITYLGPTSDCTGTGWYSILADPRIFGEVNLRQHNKLFYVTKTSFLYFTTF